MTRRTAWRPAYPLIVKFFFLSYAALFCCCASRRLDPPDVPLAGASSRRLPVAAPSRCLPWRSLSQPSEKPARCSAPRESRRGSQPGKHHVPLDLLASSILRAKNQPPHQIHRNRCLMETRCTTGFPSAVWSGSTSPRRRLARRRNGRLQAAARVFLQKCRLTDGLRTPVVHSLGSVVGCV